MPINALTPQRALVELSGLEPSEGELNTITWQQALAAILENGGTGGNVIMGAIRPDAELVQKWSYDKLIVEDEGVNIGTYSTSTLTLKSSQSITPAVTLDTNYVYILLSRGLAYPIYNSNDIGSGRNEYTISSSFDIFRYFPDDTFKAIVNGTKASASSHVVNSLSMFDSIYWSSSSILECLNSASGNGTYVNFSSPTYGNNDQATIKTPSLRAIGNASFFNSTFWGYMTDIRYQWIIELYRVPLSSDVKGWENVSQIYHLRDCVNTDSHTIS